MSHNITASDKVFTVRQPAWHGLDTNYDNYQDPEELYTQYHGWNVISEPIYRMVPKIVDGDIKETFEPIKGFTATVRSDNSDTLDVAPESSALVQNKVMYDIAEAIEDRGDGGVEIETGGSVKGGRKVWILVKMKDPIAVKGDPNGATKPYFAIQNSHDRSGAFRGQALFTRIVCDNTLQAADMETAADGMEFTFRHTKNIEDRIDDARLAIAGWREAITHWNEMMNYLIGVPFSMEQRQEFAEVFISFPASASGLVSDRVKNNVANARASFLELFNTKTLEGIEGTAYGAVQAAVEWSQHVRNTKGKTELDRLENRFTRAYLTKSELSRNAISIVRELASV